MALPSGTVSAVAVSPAPGPGEAAAIAAAIQRFAADTAIAPAAEPAGMDPWLKAALEDGVTSSQSFGPGQPFGT